MAAGYHTSKRIILLVAVIASVGGLTVEDHELLRGDVADLQVNSSIVCLSYCFSDVFLVEKCITGYFAGDCKECGIYQVGVKPFIENAIRVQSLSCFDVEYDQTQPRITCSFGKGLLVPSEDDDMKYAETICFFLPYPNVKVSSTISMTSTPVTSISDDIRTFGTVDFASFLQPSSNDVNTLISKESYQTTKMLSGTAITFDSQLQSCAVNSNDVSTVVRVTNVTITVSVATTTTVTAFTARNISTKPASTKSQIDPSSTEAFINSIVDKMTIQKNETASYKRKYVSATDERTSAKSMGVVAVLLLVGLFVFIGLMDCRHILTDICKMRTNIINALKGIKRSNSK